MLYGHGGGGGGGTVLLISESPRPHLCSKHVLTGVKSAALLFLELSINKYSIGLSNEQLFIIIAQEAAKL